MSEAGLQVGEVGVKLVLDTGLADLSAFTGLTIRAQRPNGVERTFSAVVYGLVTEGKIVHTFAAGELDVPGLWTFFAQLTGPGAEIIKGESVKVRVKAEFEV